MKAPWRSQLLLASFDVVCASGWSGHATVAQDQKPNQLSLISEGCVCVCVCLVFSRDGGVFSRFAGECTSIASCSTGKLSKRQK